MKQTIFLVLLLSTLLGGYNLFAHGSGFQLQPGEVDISMYFTPTSGTHFLAITAADDNHNLVEYEYYESVSRFGSGSAGLNSLVEVGVLPWLSLGLELGFPQIIINGLQSDFVSLTAAVTIQAQWFTSEHIALRSHLAIEADPLLGTAYSFDKGMFNFFFIPVGSTFTLYQKNQDKLALYADSKIITSLTNPAYRTLESTFEHIFQFPSGSTRDIPHNTGPIVNLALTPGVEFMLGGVFIGHIGFDVPLFSQAIGGKLHKDIFSAPELELANLEFGWRFRL